MVNAFMEHGNKYGIRNHDDVFLFGRPMYRVTMNVDEDFFNHLEQHEAFTQEADWIPARVGSQATLSADTVHDPKPPVR